MQPEQPRHAFEDDILAIQQIDAVPHILEVVCRTTGLGFAAVARVTEERWIACEVRDEMGFGLAAGGELKIETTICNEIRQHGRLVVFDDAVGDESFRHHPALQRYGFRSYISAPIVLHDGTFFGTLCAIDPRPARVNTPETIGMFRLFAGLIAFHLEARGRVTDLEAAAAQRTARLRQVNDELRRQVQASDADRQALRALTQQLESVREDERTRIARELHDELGQTLTALKMETQSAITSVGTAPAQQPARVALESITSLADTTLDAVERIVSELRPAVLDGLGIAAAAEWLVGEFARRTAIRATCDCEEDCDIDSHTATALFRILQEALTNVSRHAAASQVSVTLRSEAGSVVLTVTDNGRGIGATPMADPDAFGLRGMNERLRSLHGALEIGRAPSGGTRLVARCPSAGTA